MAADDPGICSDTRPVSDDPAVVLSRWAGARGITLTGAEPAAVRAELAAAGLDRAARRHAEELVQRWEERAGGL